LGGTQHVYELGIVELTSEVRFEGRFEGGRG